MASIQQTPQGPVLVLKESALQQKGKDAQKNNIAAAKLVADLVKTSLGPRGLDKMLVDPIGDVTITNDGATILKEIDVQHPAAKMIVEISKTMDNEVGDGTTSSVIFAGALLEKAEQLLSKDVHSSVIVEGYQAAAEKALQLLSDIAKTISPDDRVSLLKIAQTSMQSKLVSEDSETLSKIVVDAILKVAIKKAEKYTVDLDNIKVEKKSGASILDTALIKGIVLDKEIVHSGMPTKIERVTTNIDDLTEKDLGYAELVHQKKVESDKWVFVEGCRNPQSVTLLIRGGSQRVVDEVDRSIHDALMGVKDVIEKPSIVGGGGAPEAFLASNLKEWADSFDGREQLAIKKYAEALEVIPLTIAENAGMDPIDTMTNLRAKQSQGLKWTGIDARKGKI